MNGTMTRSAIRLKHWVMCHYLWAALALLLLALGFAFWIRPKSLQEWFGILGFPAVFLVTIQRQKKEELELFERLFTRFNKRYDHLNSSLNEIRSGNVNRPLNQIEI